MISSAHAVDQPVYGAYTFILYTQDARIQDSSYESLSITIFIYIYQLSAAIHLMCIFFIHIYYFL